MNGVCGILHSRVAAFSSQLHFLPLPFAHSSPIYALPIAWCIVEMLGSRLGFGPRGLALWRTARLDQFCRFEQQRASGTWAPSSRERPQARYVHFAHSSFTQTIAAPCVEPGLESSGEANFLSDCGRAPPFHGPGRPRNASGRRSSCKACVGRSRPSAKTLSASLSTEEALEAPMGRIQRSTSTLAVEEVQTLKAHSRTEHCNLDSGFTGSLTRGGIQSRI